MASDEASDEAPDGAEVTDAEAEELPSVAELYQCYVRENGGLANLRSLRTLIIKGRKVEENGATRRIAIYRKRPDKLRFKVWLDNARVETVYNGGEARRIVAPLRTGGEPKVKELSADEAAALAGDTRLEGPFFRVRGSFGAVEVAGREEVRGRPAFRLQLGPELDLPYHTIWLDEAHCQEVKLARTLPAGPDGETVEQEIYFSDFRKVAGVYGAREVAYYSDGALTQKLELESVRANVGLFDSYFEW